MKSWFSCCWCSLKDEDANLEETLPLIDIPRLPPPYFQITSSFTREIRAVSLQIKNEARRNKLKQVNLDVYGAMLEPFGWNHRIRNKYRILVALAHYLGSASIEPSVQQIQDTIHCMTLMN